MATARKLKTTIIEIISFSDGVKLFKLKPEKRIPRFKPGQFLHLAIDSYDPSFNWPESRVFSIANSPTSKDLIEVIVSKVGKFTTQMFNKLDVGDEVWIKLPYGVFNFDETHDRDTVLIAGGTGISPFISFLQFAIDNRLNTPIYLHYGVRNKDLIIIEDLLQKARLELSNFSGQIYLDDEVGTTNNNVSKGKLPVQNIVFESMKLVNPIFYLSGPPAMISAFDKELKLQGVKPENIKYDNWE